MTTGNKSDGSSMWGTRCREFVDGLKSRIDERPNLWNNLYTGAWTCGLVAPIVTAAIKVPLRRRLTIAGFGSLSVWCLPMLQVEFDRLKANKDKPLARVDVDTKRIVASASHFH